MRARSALFDLYGDHLRSRGGEAPVAALVRMLAPLGIAGPAVRTAVSRMVRQGWLTPVRLPAGPGYRLTGRAVRRLDAAARRIYRTAPRSWDRRFDLVVLVGDLPTSRPARARLTANLAFLGYGNLDASTWIAPRASPELEPLLTETGIRYHRFAAHPTRTDEVGGLVALAWDLSSLAKSYDAFVTALTPVVAGAPATGNDEVAYRARFQLVHAWRAFLFRDPQLPAALLPPGWSGTTAAAFFDHHADRLRPAADRFIDSCLT